MTWAVAFAVDVPGAYCTPMVQPWPGLRTVVEVHVPAPGPEVIIEKEAPTGADAPVIAGAAVMVSEPVAEAGLVTVTKPDFVLVLATAVVNAGVGPAKVIVAAVAVKAMVAVAPPAVVRVMFLLPAVVPNFRVKVAVTVESFTATKFVTVMLGSVFAVTDVAVARKLPWRVTLTLVPAAPEAGVIEVSVGRFTVNGTVLLTAPPVMVTETFLPPAVAVGAMVKVAVTVVSLTTAKLLTIMLPAAATFTAVAVDKCVPVRVTLTAVPARPDAGLIEVRVGPPTVKGRELVVPAGVWTLMEAFPSAAVAEMCKVAVTVVALTAAKFVTVMLGVPVLTDVAAARSVPVKVTLTAVPRRPNAGAIEVSDGATTVKTTAPVFPAGVATMML